MYPEEYLLQGSDEKKRDNKRNLMKDSTLNFIQNDRGEFNILNQKTK